MAVQTNKGEPLRPLRVGVTGHRTFDDVPAVARRVDEILADLAARGRPLEVWSSLAEGADRLVPDRALAGHRAPVIAILPLDADDYRLDFASDASLIEFDTLLATAADVRVAGPGADGSRESAYLRAGLAVLDAVDVLIALWDGQPARGVGGTAEIVSFARDRGTEVIVVPVTRPGRERPSTAPAATPHEVPR